MSSDPVPAVSPPRPVDLEAPAVVPKRSLGALERAVGGRPFEDDVVAPSSAGAIILRTYTVSVTRHITTM